MLFCSGGAGFELLAITTTFLHDGRYPELIRIYRKEESRYQSDQKQIARPRRVLAVKFKHPST